MIDATTLDEARALAGCLERREHYRNGGTKTQARERLARRIGVMPGTLYNLARDRLKRFDNSLRLALTDYAVRDLKSEIERLAHELEMARKVGVAAAAHDVAAMETRLAEMMALAGEAGK